MKGYSCLTSKYSNVPILKTNLNSYIETKPSKDLLKSSEKANNNRRTPSSVLMAKNKKSTSKENINEEELVSSKLNFYRNFSPIIDRKLLEDLKTSMSFKGKHIEKKTMKMKKVVKSPRNYLNPNLSNIKKPNKGQMIVRHKPDSQNLQSPNCVLSYEEALNEIKTIGSPKSNCVVLNSSVSDCNSQTRISIDLSKNQNAEDDKRASISLPASEQVKKMPKSSIEIINDLKHEISRLNKMNDELTTENKSLRMILKDFEETKQIEIILNERIESYADSNHQLHMQLNLANK